MTDYVRKLAEEALLSNKERRYLKGKLTFDRKPRSEFHKHLTLRYRNLVKDLRIISDDQQKKKLLENWKLKNSFEFQYYFLENIFWKSFNMWENAPERFYPLKIHRTKRKRTSYYWVEVRKIANLSPNEVKKTLNPKYMFTLIKRVKISYEEKNDLIKGYENGVIPTSKNKAISRKEINKRVKEKFSPITKEKKVEFLTEVEKNPQNKKILEICRSKKFQNLRKKMNKLLEPYGSKVQKVQPYLYPISSQVEKYYEE